MGRWRARAFLVAAAALLAGCGGARTRPTALETSAPERPAWLNRTWTDTADGFVVVGMASRARSIEEADRAARLDAVARICEAFFGIEARAVYQEVATLDAVDVRQEIGARSMGRVLGAKATETYWERRSAFIDGELRPSVDAWVQVRGNREEIRQAIRQFVEERQARARWVAGLRLADARGREDDPGLLAVQVTGPAGPEAGVPVAFRVSRGAGTVEPTALSSADGVARARLSGVDVMAGAEVEATVVDADGGPRASLIVAGLARGREIVVAVAEAGVPDEVAGRVRARVEEALRQGGFRQVSSRSMAWDQAEAAGSGRRPPGLKGTHGVLATLRLDPAGAGGGFVFARAALAVTVMDLGTGRVLARFTLEDRVGGGDAAMAARRVVESLAGKVDAQRDRFLSPLKQ